MRSRHAVWPLSTSRSMTPMQVRRHDYSVHARNRPWLLWGRTPPLIKRRTVPSCPVPRPRLCRDCEKGEDGLSRPAHRAGRVAHLEAMSDREIEDIGLTRSQIESAVRGERRSSAQVNLARSSTSVPPLDEVTFVAPHGSVLGTWATQSRRNNSACNRTGGLAAGVPTADHMAEIVRPAVGINELIGIPSHLSLPPLDVRH